MNHPRPARLANAPPGTPVPVDWRFRCHRMAGDPMWIANRSDLVAYCGAEVAALRLSVVDSQGTGYCVACYPE